MKSGDVLVMSGDMKSQVVGTAGEVQVAHVADVGCVEVQQLVTEQRLVTTQLHLAHLQDNTRTNDTSLTRKQTAFNRGSRSDHGGSTLGPGGGAQSPQIVARPPNLAVLLTHCGQLILRNN